MRGCLKMTKRLVSWLATFALALALPAWGDEDFDKAMELVRKTDYVGAMKLLRVSAGRGNPDAKVELGKLLIIGEEIDDGRKLFESAIEQGSLQAKVELAVLITSGKLGAPDYAHARKLAVEAAEAGHPGAVKMLAYAYINRGLGLSAQDVSDPEPALKWFREAEKLDYVPALEKLADLYTKGGLGLQPNPEMAAAYKKRVRELSGQPEETKKKRRSRL